MSLPRFSLSHPHTIAAVIILVCLLASGAVWRMPIDIFPSIDIPVVSVVWTYNGMSAEEMQDRILIKHERQMASLVDDIARIEANSYTGVGVIKVYLHEGADVSRAVSQLASCAQTVLKSMPRNITPPSHRPLQRHRRAGHPAQPRQPVLARPTADRHRTAGVATEPRSRPWGPGAVSLRR